MPNLRIIADNAADRATSLAASTTSGSLAASLMQNDLKGQAHRSTATSVTYTLTWTNAESIGAVALPATNLSASATVRVRLYSDAAGLTLVADSGTVSACPGLNLGTYGWTAPRNVNAFAYAGASKTAVWLPAQYSARRCVIDLVDTSNPAGYIDCARVVAGSWWSPEDNASYGAQASIEDTSARSRTDAGDALADRGTLYDTLSFELQMMPEADRAAVLRLVRNVGTSRNFFISLLPSNGTGVVAEQDHMIFGKRASAGLSFDFYNAFGTKFSMEGW